MCSGGEIVSFYTSNSFSFTLVTENHLSEAVKGSPVKWTGDLIIVSFVTDSGTTTEQACIT